MYHPQYVTHSMSQHSSSVGRGVQGSTASEPSGGPCSWYGLCGDHQLPHWLLWRPRCLQFRAHMMNGTNTEKWDYCSIRTAQNCSCLNSWEFSGEPPSLPPALLVMLAHAHCRARAWGRRHVACLIVADLASKIQVRPVHSRVNNEGCWFRRSHTR